MVTITPPVLEGTDMIISSRYHWRSPNTICILTHTLGRFQRFLRRRRQERSHVDCLSADSLMRTVWASSLYSLVVWFVITIAYCVRKKLFLCKECVHFKWVFVHHIDGCFQFECHIFVLYKKMWFCVYTVSQVIHEKKFMISGYWWN